MLIHLECLPAFDNRAVELTAQEKNIRDVRLDDEREWINLARAQDVCLRFVPSAKCDEKICVPLVGGRMVLVQSQCRAILLFRVPPSVIVAVVDTGERDMCFRQPIVELEGLQAGCSTAR